MNADGFIFWQQNAPDLRPGVAVRPSWSAAFHAGNVFAHHRIDPWSYDVISARDLVGAQSSSAQVSRMR